MGSEGHAAVRALEAHLTWFDTFCLPAPLAANPKDDPSATPIYEVEDISRLNADTSTRGTQWGTGGMATKLTAGRIATAAGCTMVICNSTVPENIVRIVTVRNSNDLYGFAGRARLAPLLLLHPAS